MANKEKKAGPAKKRKRAKGKNKPSGSAKKPRKPLFENPFSTDEQILGRFFTNSQDVPPQQPDAQGGPSPQETAIHTPVPIEKKPAPEPETQKKHADEITAKAKSFSASFATLKANPGAKGELGACLAYCQAVGELAGKSGMPRLAALCKSLESAIYEFSDRDVSSELIDTLQGFDNCMDYVRDQVTDPTCDESIDTVPFDAKLAILSGQTEPQPELTAKPKDITDHIDVFVQELGENIDTIDASLLSLEKEPSNQDEINSIFRLTHNMKGISNSLGLAKLEDLCHGVESVLSEIRSQTIPAPAETLDLLFEFNDLLREFNSSLADKSSDENIDIKNLVSRLAAARKELKPAHAPPPAPEEMDDERRHMLDMYMPDFLQEFGEHIDVIELSLLKLEVDPGLMDEINNCFRQIHNMKGMSNALGFKKLGALCHSTESALSYYRETKTPVPKHLLDICLQVNDTLRAFNKNLSATYHEGDIDTSSIMAALEAIQSTRSGETPEPQPGSKPGDKHAGNPSTAVQLSKEKISTIRVNVSRLDHLMNSVGELVLLRNRYNQLNHQLVNEEKTEQLIEDFNNLASQLDMVTGSLQGAVMSTRMLPVGNIFSKFNRVVRDLCRALGKEADLIISGSETELDKNLIESISDPLMHIIRNCVDHGIEFPDDRVKEGKPRRGSIHLNAFQEGNSIIIEIIDDGKGIDQDVIVTKVLEKKLLPPESVEALSPAERLSLIFLPGFSTAEEVSDVSGRGVGMDVVKTNIENLKGQIDIESQKGKGTRIKIRIPLTLAIMQTLLCQVEDERLAIPLFSVIETVRLPLSGIEWVSGVPVVRLREEILPVIFMNKLLDLESEVIVIDESNQLDIVVVKIGIKQVGLVVDRTIGQEEVLIKPLDSLQGIYNAKYISGATILGDGSIALILDVTEIINVAKLIDSEIAERMRVDAGVFNEELVLLLSDGQVEQYGMALKGINKLSIIDINQIENVGAQDVIKYGDEILPVTRAPYITGFKPPSYLEKVYVIVLTKQGRKAGLIVNKLSGLVKVEKSALERATGKLALDEALIINNRVTLLFSTDQVFASAAEKNKTRTYSIKSGTGLLSNARTINNILVVDDSKTQRDMICRILAEAGYNVTQATDGEEGLGMVNGVDLIVTDLEMPRIDGCEFTRIVKRIHPSMPVIMLTNYAQEEYVSQALEAGVDQFLIKLDAEDLLEAIKKSEWM